jgi:hypothetical protein
MKTVTKSRAVILQFSVVKIWMLRAVGSWLVTLGAFGDMQWGESTHLLDTVCCGRNLGLETIGYGKAVEQVVSQCAQC